MRISKILKQQVIPIVLSFSMITTLGVPSVKGAEKSGQPYASYWFPKDILKWSPENDVYNVSYVPLAERISKSKLSFSKDSQSKDMEVVAISIMNSTTSGNPSQGSNQFSSNTFSYWQYIDKLVYWGGSSGEGIIVPPSADVIDSSHRNGVPVLGTVFFPQEEHGGKIEWLNQTLEKNEDGSFPIADKLIEVANTFKFDGWFINQETVGGDEETSNLMQEFIKYFKSKAPNLEIMWYDSMTETGEVDWQNALNEKNQMFLIDSNNKPVSDSMFLNFWWNTEKYAKDELLRVSNENAKKLDLNPYSLFAGIDTQAEGTATKVDWSLMEGTNGYYTSIGLYCPSWTFFSSNSVEEFLQKEAEFWADGTKDGWKPISDYVVEKSPITESPFVTNFSMGNGKYYFADGKKVSDTEWNNRSLQDIMPTYRWSIENGRSNLTASIDYEDAYNGGNSILLSGRLIPDSSSTIKLFASDLNINDSTVISSAIKTNSNKIKVNLVLDFYDNTKAVIESDNSLTNQWNKTEYDISDYRGKQIKTMSFEITSSEDLDDAKINLGNLSVVDSNYSHDINVNNVKVNKVYTQDNINANIAIEINDLIQSDNLNRYEVYYVTQTGDKLVGATVNPNYYVQDIKREGKEDKATFKVVSLNANGVRSDPATFSIKWGKYPAPKADFSFDKTVIKPGESVTFKNLSSETTEQIEWTFTGGDIEKTSDENPTVTYSKEGVYTVSLTARNSSGTDKMVKDGIVTVTSKSDIDVIPVQSVKASSFVNDNEAPEFAIDDSSETKWCAVGNGPHSITLDLGKTFSMSEIDISHAGAGGENKDFNTQAYTISTSVNGKDFTEAIKVTDNSDNITKDHIKVTNARYVKLTIDKATQGGDKAARIYDIKVIGY